MGLHSGSGALHINARLPRAWDGPAPLTPGTPSKYSSALHRRPPPERDRFSVPHRFLTWLLMLTSLMAAGMGGYILGVSRSTSHYPTSLTIVASSSHAETIARESGSTGSTKAADGKGGGPAGMRATTGGGPERALSQYEMRRAAAVQIPGGVPDGKAVQAKSEATQLDLPPCRPGAGDGFSCGGLLGQPKVALMFLTPGAMPHEGLWRAWLEAAQGLVRVDCLESAPQGPSLGGGPAGDASGQQGPQGAAPSYSARLMQACAGPARGDVVSRQHLFSVYVHTPPGHAGYEEPNLFKGHVIANRTATDWGDHSLAEATQLLMRAALGDGLNQRFVLLSDSCAPLYSAPATYLQLMGRPLSRINACSRKASDLNRERWRPVLEDEGGLPLEQWRKSAQWFGLVRQHALLVAADSQLLAAFGKLCKLEKKVLGRAFLNCHSDENYIPSLLAKAGLDNETDCFGGITYSEWLVSKYGDFYPRWFLPSEISGDLLEHLRSAEDVCEAAHANAAVEPAFARIETAEGGSQIRLQSCTGSEGGQEPKQAIQAAALPYHCPLFARKFSAYTTDALLGLYHLDEGLVILHGFCPSAPNPSSFDE